MRRNRTAKKGSRPPIPSQASTEGEALKYQAVINLKSKNNSHTQLVLMTGRNKKVLEVGPALGYMSKVLKDRGCRVTGVEIDPIAANVAEQFCERMIVGDIEQLDFASTFKRERFDVIIYGDVLEHLVHPDAVLKKTAGLLKTKGYVVASIPNIAHGSIRLSLLAGHFTYSEMGLLDNTHLRFYTRDTIRQLFRDSGFVIRNWNRTTADPFQTEIEMREDDFPSRLIEGIRREEDALTYQYVVKAVISESRRKNRSPSVKRSPQVVRELGQHIASVESENVQKAHEIASRDAVIASWEAVNASKDLELTDKIREIAERDAVIAEKNEVIVEKEQQLRESVATYETVTGTIGYRFLERLRRAINRLAPAGTRRRSFVVVFGHGVEVLMTKGWGAFFVGLLRVWRWIPRLFRRAPLPRSEPLIGPTEILSLDDQYQLWLDANELTSERRQMLTREADELDYRPMISIVVPVYNTDPGLLTEAIESVRNQIYENWELCLADDGSTRPDTRSVLRRYSVQDTRINVEFLKSNAGIAAASNTALGLSTGAFVGLLDHDDELKPDALLEVVKLLNDDRDLDYIYTDEDKKGPDGRLVQPFFKPDWSPELLQCINYVTHFSVYRKEILNEIGSFHEGYEGSQDYDLVLRVTELTNKIAHVPKPLYTWRMIPGSAAGSVEAKPFAYEAAKKALEDSLARRRISGDVLDGPFKGSYRVRHSIAGNPRVEVIIPTRDNLDLLETCIESITEQSTYRNYHIVVVDNQSSDPETLRYLKGLDGRVIRFPQEFNFSKIVNLAAREVAGDVLLFLNNDTEVITPDWIEAMLEHAQRPDVAAVGARLLFSGGSPQHEGIIVGPFGGLAINAKGLHDFGLDKLTRDCSAVTAACMMTRREVFWELGGFEERLAIAYNDVDFCLRAREKGYQVLYTPYAQLYHYESATRKSLHPRQDQEFFRKRWNEPDEYRDPYCNPNLDPTQAFRLKVV